MKVLLFTHSYKRPHMLRQCILDAKNQSYTDFTYSINIMYDDISEIANYENLFDDILDSRFIICYTKNSSYLANAISTLLHCPEPYDLYIKIDDDDIHKRDYVKTIVEYFETHQFDVLSSPVGYQLNNYFMSKGKHYTFLGDPPINNHLMALTYAFSHKAYQIMLNIKDNNGDETIQWRNAWIEAGLKADTIDNSDNIVWHIHGKNTCIPHWFRTS